MQSDIPQGVIANTRSLSAKMTVGTKRQLDMAFAACLLVFARHRAVMLNIIEIVVVWPDRGFVGMADGTTPWRALFDHMTIMAHGLERLVDDHSQVFDQFQIGLTGFLE
jgi:hypothetical protein